MRRASQSDMRCSNLMPLVAVTSVKNFPFVEGLDGAEAMVVVTFFAGGSTAFLSSST